MVNFFRLGAIGVMFVTLVGAQTYPDCDHICRETAESAKKSCLADNCKLAAATAGAAASLAAAVACGYLIKSPTAVRACDKAAGVAAAYQAYSHCQTTCSATGALVFGTCMSGCLPPVNSTQVKPRSEE